ncbi:hypothetical protein WS67_05760 [Burkholderia singularis]|uniref:Lipoprotein n=1 Tax=Burkholderia singularis TaxID=1503053 RepID=A0A103E6N2_9BURK|nr:DUF2242 domain-containing protein [Burkholderia singularis]KVE29355.1 hypothetical protein WS67_05760 [Burkholderia singularis]
MATAALLCACSSTQKPLYQQEQFDAAASPYARTFHDKSAATCEAARRALLSQGYMASATRPDAIDGSKNFQPSNDSHVVIEFHVVCADADADGASSVAYVNAVQDRYSLKKTNTSASVGLSVFGSLSLPIGSSDDAMVKIASETIPAGMFYERFFNLVDHFLKIDPTRRDKATVAAAQKERVAPLPEPAATADETPMKLNTPSPPPAATGSNEPASDAAANAAPAAAASTPAATPAPASPNTPAHPPAPASTLTPAPAPSQPPAPASPASAPSSQALPSADAAASMSAAAPANPRAPISMPPALQPATSAPVSAVSSGLLVSPDANAAISLPGTRPQADTASDIAGRPAAGDGH